MVNSILSLRRGTIFRRPFKVFDAPNSDMLSVDDVECLSSSSLFSFALREAMASSIFDI